MENSITPILFSLVSLISPLFIFIACCYYLIKQGKADAVLLFIGSSVGLLLNIFYSVVMPYLIRVGSMSVSEAARYYTFTGVISFIAGICFATGLFILIYNTVNSNKITANQFPPNNS